MTVEPPSSEASILPTDPTEFAHAVREASNEELATAMGGDSRDEILAEIFHQMESRVRPDRVAGIEGAIHWRIRGRPDGGEDIYEVAFHDGACSARKGTTTTTPRAIMTVDPVGFLKLMAQATSSTKLVLTRKLRVHGEVGFAMRSEHFFRKPLDED